MHYRKALLVDDDPVFRALAEDLILDAGVGYVTLAADGDEALAALDNGFDADLIVCDLNMPAHDGVSLIRTLAERRYAGKVVLVSGEAPGIIEAVARLARMQGLAIIGSMRKPLTLRALNDVLGQGAPAPKTTGEGPAVPSLLDAAIDRGGLLPFFQAKVSMADGRITGAEALARIAITQTDFASPIPYIELAERNDRIDDLTIAMTRLVARQAKTFFIDGRPMPVSINISPVSFKRLDLPDLIAAAVEGEGLSPKQFTLEVTETRLLEYGREALDIFTRLRLKGFGLSVDDFGTGYSNIDRLQMYPFTELKIDQSFTRNAPTDGFARASVEMSVRLAKEMGLRVVAEGVETQEMWNFLADLGIDEAQGYLMARPMPPQDFARLLAQGFPQPAVALRA